MRNKFVVVGLVVIGVILATALSLQLFVYFWITPVLNAVFKESVSYYSSGLYEVTYEDMDVNALSQSVSFKDFQLNYDSARVEAEDSLRKGKWVAAYVGDFELSLDNFWSMIPQRYLKINALKIKSPRLTVVNYDLKKPKKQDSISLDKIRQFDAHALIKEYFDSLDVVELEIQKANLKWVDKKSEQLPFSLGDVHANILKLHIDSGTVNRNYGYPYAEEFILEVENTTFITPDSLYTLRFGHLRADPVKEELLIDSFSMEPQKPLYQFARDLGYQKERINLLVANIDLQHIDLHYLVSDLALLVGKIIIEDAELFVFKDKRLPRPPFKVKPMVQEAILNIPIPFRLDTLKLLRGNIAYREHVPDAEETGQITFEDLYMTAYNISNLDSLRKLNQSMEADIQTRLMGKSQLNLHFNFPMNSPSQQHYIRGEMYEFALKDMNAMVENTAFASVESGHAFALKFDLYADEKQSSGDVHFAYRDLKIKLVNKKKPNDPSLKEVLGSLVANMFVIKQDNPSSNSQPLRIGAISFERNPDKSVFAYWWKSLLSGLKGSMGINNDEAEPKKEEEKEGFFKRLFRKKESD